MSKKPKVRFIYQFGYNIFIFKLLGFCIKQLDTRQIYVFFFTDGIGKIPVPIADSITNSSVSLRWIWNSTASDIIQQHNSTVTLQLRHVQQEMGGTWETVPSSSKVSQSHAVVNELQPYCNYRVSSRVINRCYISLYSSAGLILNAMKSN